MRTKFTILFILNSLAIASLTYFLLYEIEHHAQRKIIVLILIVETVSIYAILKLYLKYMSRPTNSTSNARERKATKPGRHA